MAWVAVASLLLNAASLVLLIGLHRRKERRDDAKVDALVEGLAFLLMAESGLGARGTAEEFRRQAARLLRAKEA